MDDTVERNGGLRELSGLFRIVLIDRDVILRSIVVAGLPQPAIAVAPPVYL
jgi:hypothetical protein